MRELSYESMKQCEVCGLMFRGNRCPKCYPYPKMGKIGKVGGRK